jgi:hypothetical protein
VFTTLGVAVTVDKHKNANISVNFRKNSNTQGPEGKGFVKKTGSRKSRVRIPFRYKLHSKWAYLSVLALGRGPVNNMPVLVLDASLFTD